MTALVSSVISHTFGFLGSLDKVPVISVSEMIAKKSLINEWNSVGCVFTSLSSTSRNEGFSFRDAIVVCFSRWMQWLLTSHMRRYHRHYGSSGHVWQGRFKAYPIQQDEHLLTVLRYIERNPLRAGLVEQAERWPWSSLGRGQNSQDNNIVCQWPVAKPENWVWWMNQPQTDGELEALRHTLIEERRMV